MEERERREDEKTYRSSASGQQSEQMDHAQRVVEITQRVLKSGIALLDQVIECETRLLLLQRLESRFVLTVKKKRPREAHENEPKQGPRASTNLLHSGFVPLLQEGLQITETLEQRLMCEEDDILLVIVSFVFATLLLLRITREDTLQNAQSSEENIDRS